MRKKPIHLNRMYLLADGRHFLVMLPHDRRRAEYMGKVVNIYCKPEDVEPGCIPTMNILMPAEVLRRSELVPVDQQPWGL